jgi:hypothetical protein
MLIPFLTFSAVRFDDAYISWINNGQMVWTLYAAGVAADPRVEISARPVPQEPMVNTCRLPPPIYGLTFLTSIF